MSGKRTKKKSKRTKLSKVYKVQKKVREHHRKLRRDKKRHPEKYPKKKSDPGVPNSCPFKTQLIHDATEAKKTEEERRRKLNKELKLRRKEERQALFNSNRNIKQVVQDAEDRGKEFEETQKSVADDDVGKFSDRSAKAYYKEFKKVVEAADVILEVLDARDPEGSRCLPMEDMVKADSRKRLVLVLNKADLVPKSNLEAWLKYFRKYFPTLLFKANTQTQSSHISQVKTKSLKSNLPLNTAKCVGADLLLQLMKNYCRNKNMKTAIVVGVVGMPNVGKSSLINSMKRSRVCSIGATPGVTKTMQEVILDSKVRLLDCPGVVLPSQNSSDAASSLRSAFKIEDLKDPVTPVEAILERAGKDKMMVLYRLPQFENTNEFLALYASKFGRLSKGGRPNIEAAARAVLRDWNVGRIKYYTNPPVEEESHDGSALLVSEYSKEFQLDELETTEEVVMASLPDVRPSETVQVEGFQPIKSVDQLCDVEKEMDIDTSKQQETDVDHSTEQGSVTQEKELLTNVVVDLPATTEMETESVPEKKERWETAVPELDYSTVSLKKLQKKASKKHRKERGRNDRRTEDLVQIFGAFTGLNDKDTEDTYDFNDYLINK